MAKVISDWPINGDSGRLLQINKLRLADATLSINFFSYMVLPTSLQVCAEIYSSDICSMARHSMLRQSEHF